MRDQPAGNTQLRLSGNALSGIRDCRVALKGPRRYLVLLSDSITDTLFTIHEADQIGANCQKLSISRLLRLAASYIHAAPREHGSLAGRT
jgi:hypothetical protein